MSEGTVLAQQMRPAAERRPFVDHALVQLTLVRFREFWREPEAVFWVFIFPILLTTGLGIAFRNRPADVVKIGAVGSQLAAALRTEKSLAVDVLDLAAGEQALRAGRIILLATPAAGGGVTYHFDDTNPEARNARMLVDRTVQHAAGARDPVPVMDALVREPGSRYIDFLVPGLLGMNLMGSGIWGLYRRRSPEKTAQTADRLAHAAQPVSAVIPAVAPDVPLCGSGRAGGLRRSGVRGPCARAHLGAGAALPDLIALF